MKNHFRLPSAALCGRYFIRGMIAFWIFLVIFIALPAEPLWLLHLVILCWLASFTLTFGCYLLILLRRLGIAAETHEEHTDV